MSKFRCLMVAMVLTISGLMSGCGSDAYYKQGIGAIERGEYDEGLATLETGMKKYPDSTKLRAAWLGQKTKVVEDLLVVGDRALTANSWDEAETQYKRVVKIEPNNGRAKARLEVVAVARRHAEILDEAHSLFEKDRIQESEAMLRRIFAENPAHEGAKLLQRQIDERRAVGVDAPSLNTLYKGPVTLELRDANIKVALEVLSKTSGVNFALDKEVRPDLAVTLFVRQASLEDVVNLMLTTYQLKKKILNDKTVLIYSNTPNKVKEYEALVVKAFYLTNVDAKKMSEVIKSFLKTRDIIVEERLNVLILRDNIEVIRGVERLVALLDVPEPEVMLEVEVLEIQSSRLHDIGVKFPDQINMSVLPSSGATTASGGLTIEDLKHINGGRIGVNNISTSINLKRELSDANVLANPSIRARNREKAKIKIGDRVPVITTTQSTTGNTSSDNVQYLDVGLNVEVEPDVRMDNEVAIKLALEVSSVVKEVRGGFGSIAYQIGTRNVNTILRLRDGETQVLGGLIRDDERQISSRVPGLGDIPLLGRLFSNNHDEKQKTEIVLAITPHVIRNVYWPSAAAGQFWSGTEERFSIEQPWRAATVLKPTAEQDKVPDQQPAPASQVVPAAATQTAPVQMVTPPSITPETSMPNTTPVPQSAPAVPVVMPPPTPPKPQEAAPVLMLPKL